MSLNGVEKIDHQTLIRAASAALVVLVVLAGAACGSQEVPGSSMAVTPAASAAEATAPVPATAPAAEVQYKEFPPRDHLNKIVAAYTVANDHPELLTGLPCYCPCELYGHGGVIDCHKSQHSAMCDVCMSEAVEAGQLYEAQLASGVDDIAAVQAQVKDRYRRGLVARTAQQYPMMNTPQGQAFLQACSDCHQPPSPAMHLPGDWDATAARMESFARDSGRMPPEETWRAAVEYVKSVAAQVPAASVAQNRAGLKRTVEHLKITEGDAAYYPSARDEVLDVAWAERMVAAYNAAREIDDATLANTTTACQPCRDAGNTSLLACLNSWQAITCETAIEEVEKLAAELAGGS